MKSIEIKEPDVVVSEFPSHPEHSDWGPKESVVYNTRISGDPKGRSAIEIWKNKKESMGKKELLEEEEGFLEFLAERGHISAFYRTNVGITYKVPRHTTLFFCSFDHPKYMQQSQRYTKAKEFISLIDSTEAKEMFSKQSQLYNKMIENKSIPKEDARYILPLGTAATHLHQNTNIAGLMNIYRVLRSNGSEVPDMTEDIFKDCIGKLEELEPSLFNEKIMNLLMGADKGYPVANMFSQKNEWVDKALKNHRSCDVVSRFTYEVTEKLKNKADGFNDEALSFLNLNNSPLKVEGYVTTMSISAWHQFMRNDTVKNSVESIYSAADRGKMVIPPKIKDSEFEEDYIDIFEESLKLYESLKKQNGRSTAIEVLPHGLGIGVAFGLDGFNRIKGFLPDRTQEAAQWEIRAIARKVAKEL